MKTICFYHRADLDGHCSGAIVHRSRPDAALIGIDYGDPFPWDRIDNETEVIMVDWSLQPIEGMVRLLGACERLVWIDHHESAIKESALHPPLYTVPGIRLIGKAACEFTWEWFFDNPVPISVWLLGAYDTWRLSEHDDVLAFQTGMRSLSCTLPTDPVWDTLLTPDSYLVRELSNKGHLLLDYQATQDAKYCSSYAFPTELFGLKVVAVNHGISNSIAFKSVWDPEKYDAMCSFVRRPDGRWKVSLYTDNPWVNVGEFCKLHGGGGHAQAAGFIAKECPF